MKSVLSTLKKYLYIFLLIQLVKSQNISLESTIGFVLPISAQPNIGLIYRFIFAIWICFFIFFLFFRKSFFIGLQKQAVIFQGFIFGVEMSLNSIGKSYFSGITWIISIITAPICAVLSVNDKFMKTFLCMLNSFGICYIITILFRFTIIFNILICGVILYFVLVLIVNRSEKMQLCFAKIFTMTIAFLTLLQLTGLINIFLGLHGIEEGLGKKIFHYGLSLVIFSLVTVFFVSFTYFSNWLDEKIEQVEEVMAARNNELQPASE